MPQRTLSLGKYIGDYVFATSNYLMALMYLCPKDRLVLMNPGELDPNILIADTADNFIKHDKGGTIYKLPCATFSKTPQSGLSDFEVVSIEAVKPLSRKTYKSCLKAWRANKITIRFADEITCKKLINNPDQKELISNLPIFC